MGEGEVLPRREEMEAGAREEEESIEGEEEHVKVPPGTNKEMKAQ